MKKTFIVIMMVLSLALSGCAGLNKGKDSEFLNLSVGKVYDYEWSRENNAPLAEAEYPVIYLSDEDAVKYPELKATVDKINEDTINEYGGMLEELKQDAYNFMEYAPGYPVEFSNLNGVKVKRADELLLSLLYDSYSYYGGAHGNTYFLGETYSTKTGEKLSLSDVVNDVDILPELVEEHLNRYWSDVEFFEDYDLKGMFEEETVQWTLDYNGITFYFNAYDLAPYAAGVQVVTLTKEEYPEILKAEYMSAPASYSFEITKGVPYFCDIYNDAVADMVNVYAYTDDYSGAGQLTITINDMTYTEDLYLYDGDFSFVSTEDGKKLILLELAQDGDYHVIYVYDITSGVRKLGEVEGGMKGFYDKEKSVWLESVLTNPEKFYIETRTNILSTVNGCKEYHIGEDGMPETFDTNLILDETSAPELTLLIDIETEVYDINKGKATGKRVIEKGEKVVYYATDEDNYVFFKCEDGTIVRKEYTKQDFNISVDGVDMWEAFDGLFFAG